MADHPPRVAVVTGAGSGIGAAVAHALAGQGWVVVPARELDTVPLREWNAVVAVNLTGAFLCTREVLRVMRQQRPRGGRIINNGSISAHVPRPDSVACTAPSTPSPG